MMQSFTYNTRMSGKIKKAIFPVAGLGTRFLPATKASPKEMLPIVDKPLIQYAVEEALAAGITELIFVTSSAKRAIEDHFDSNFELESNLEAKGKYELLSIVRDILPQGVSSVYVRQTKPRGLGHAILCAEHIVGDEPFAVLLADDLIADTGSGCLSYMAEQYQRHKSSILAVEKVPEDKVSCYGIVSLEKDRIKAIVEKPKIDQAPSNLAAVGRYILTPQIFAHLKTTKAGANREIQLTDAIAAMLQDEAVYAHYLKGVRYDCGSKLGYIKATINYALSHPEIGAEVKQHLSDLYAKFSREVSHEA